MDRLTKYNSAGVELIEADGQYCVNICGKQDIATCNKCPISQAFYRLAEYEDTGLTPDEVKNRLKEADERCLRKSKTFQVILTHGLNGVTSLISCLGLMSERMHFFAKLMK